MSRSGKLKKVVAFGGGTGLSTLLRGLKSHHIDLTAVVSVADDGGSSGRLLDEYDIPLRVISVRSWQRFQMLNPLSRGCFNTVFHPRKI